MHAVIIGATPEGKKELLGFRFGLRESAQSWRELLVGLRGRGLSVAPEIAVGDSAMGFWNALDEIFPSTKHQRCWVHKVKNGLNQFPKPMTAVVKSDLNDIQHAETRAEALVAINLFKEKYGVKFEKAVACLTLLRRLAIDRPNQVWCLETDRLLLLVCPKPLGSTCHPMPHSVHYSWWTLSNTLYSRQSSDTGRFRNMGTGLPVPSSYFMQTNRCRYLSARFSGSCPWRSGEVHPG